MRRFNTACPSASASCNLNTVLPKSIPTTATDILLSILLRHSRSVAHGWRNIDPVKWRKRNSVEDRSLLHISCCRRQRSRKKPLLWHCARRFWSRLILPAFRSVNTATQRCGKYWLRSNSATKTGSEPAETCQFRRAIAAYLTALARGLNTNASYVTCRSHR